MIYTIKSDKLTVKINSLGAEMISVVKDGKERLWQNGDGSWDGHALTLFPFCSTVKVYVNGKYYPNVIHGIAWISEFSLVSASENSLTLRLVQSDETKKHYPFDFTLDITFEIESDSIKITNRIYNPMDIPLPYAFGSHESYALDLSIDEYYLEFEKDEHFKNYSYAKRKTPLGYGDMGCGNTLALSNEYFKNDASLVFADMNSRWIKLCKKDGTVLAKVEYDDIYHDLVCWKTESGSYICIEPWMNLCDFDSDDRTEFSEKRGICSLMPKCEDVRSHKIMYY